MAITWNAPAIALTLNAIIAGLAASSLFLGDDSLLPSSLKPLNVHASRTIGHELFGACFLMIGSVANNKAQQMCPFWGAACLVSAASHVMADDMGGGMANFCFAMVPLYLGLIWNKKGNGDMKHS